MSEPMVENPTAQESSDGSPWQERKALLLVVGVAAVVVGGLGAWFLLSGGSGDDEGGLVAKPAPRATTSASATPTAAATVPAKVSDLGLARDPFKDLYVKPVDDASTGGTAAVLPMSTPVVVTENRVDTSTSSPVQTSSPVRTAPATVRVKVVRIDLEGFRAKVSVNGGKAYWMRPDQSTSTVPQVTLYDVAGTARNGFATFYVGDDPDDSVDVPEGRTHRFS